MQRVEEKVLLRTCKTWDGHYARVMLLLLPINKTFPWILNRAKRKCADIFGTCTCTDFLPSKVCGYFLHMCTRTDFLPPTFKEKTRRQRSPLSPQGRDDGVPEQQPDGDNLKCS